ncbi:MAG: rRNA maturation RNase YbeY [Sphingobacteriaceae bacterium]|nr:rRNA maturation RNase YbeY [Sphingobacteriaceae bacterium]
MAISFTSQYKTFKLSKSTSIKKWIETIIKKEKRRAGEIHYVFVSDEDLLKMNKKFLNHNTYTDIITFDYCEDKTINGDIFISIDRVKDNASKFKTEFTDELHRVLIHGVLHLCGYKDKTKKDASLMRKMEENSLSKRSF